MSASHLVPRTSRRRFSPGVRAAFALALGLALASPLPLAAQAVTSAFTYQGELRSGGSPANANFDMQFLLYNADIGGSQIGPVVTQTNVAAINGLFNVQLDFGAAQFAGDRQWLELRIRPAGSGSYETLSPRTEVTATPYALGAVAALPNAVTTTSIVDGTIGTTDVNAAEVQRRVTGTCPSGQYVRIVAQDGSVTCGTDATGTGTVTSIATGAGLSGGPITTSGTLSVAPGGIGTAQINSAEVQRRVTGTCTGTNYVQQVNADGTVGCGPAPAAVHRPRSRNGTTGSARPRRGPTTRPGSARSPARAVPRPCTPWQRRVVAAPPRPPVATPARPAPEAQPSPPARPIGADARCSFV